MSVNDFETSDYAGKPRRLFRFSMGTQLWGYCQADVPHVHLTLTYEPEVIDLEEISLSLSEQSPTINVQISSGAEVCQQFIAYQPVKPIFLRTYRYHVEDDEYVTELIGEVVSAAFDESIGMCTLLVRFNTSYMDRTVPWPVFQKQCNRAPYSSSCGVNREDFRTNVNVQAVLGDEMRDPVFATLPDGWFTAGFVETADGDTRFIISHVGDTIVLQAPFRSLPNGSPVSVFAGDDLLRTTCKDKFDNYPRWLGFGWVPTTNPFTDNIFGTGYFPSSGKSRTDWRKAINPAGWNGSWGLF